MPSPYITRQDSSGIVGAAGRVSRNLNNKERPKTNERLDYKYQKKKGTKWQFF